MRWSLLIAWKIHVFGWIWRLALLFLFVLLIFCCHLHLFLFHQVGFRSTELNTVSTVRRVVLYAAYAKNNIATSSTTATTTGIKSVKKVAMGDDLFFFTQQSSDCDKHGRRRHKRNKETKTTNMYSAVKINARYLRSCAVHTGQIINTRRFGSDQRYDRID